MLKEADKSGFGTSEATAGIVTSLCAVSELLGGFLASTVGGFVAETLGFPVSTIFVVAVQISILAILIILGLWKIKSMLYFQSSLKNIYYSGINNATQFLYKTI